VTVVRHTSSRWIAIRVGPRAGIVRSISPSNGPSVDWPSVSMRKPSGVGASAMRTSRRPAAG
jgi:hypothetical protein